MLVVLAFGLSATASASTYPGQRLVLERQVPAQVKLALAFWAKRGVSGCPTSVRAYFADSIAPGAVGSSGEVGSCEIYLSAPAIKSLREYDSADDREVECMLIFHEVGHALGLEHSAEGLMAASPITVPYDCVKFARRLADRQRNQRHRRHVDPGR